MTTLAMPQANANQSFETKTSPVTAQQSVSRNEARESVVNGSELLTKLKNNEMIGYQGLKFDTPKLRSLQQGKELSNFDFIIRDNETGLSFRDTASSDKRFLILMPPEQLESLINIAIAKDNGKAREEERPENPHEWQYQSTQPQYLTEAPEGRRPMTSDEMKTVYEQAVDTIFQMHKSGVIDMGQVIDKYAERIGGMSGVALKTIYYATPLFVFKNKIMSYSDQVVVEMQKSLAGEPERKAEFEKEKAEAIAQYDYAQKIKLEEEEKIAAAGYAKEQQRKESLVSITGQNFKPTIEETPNEKILSFEEEGRLISITHSKAANKTFGQISLFDQQGNWAGNKEIQPEEWADISRVLAKNLTAEQKGQLGSDFLKSVSNKSTVNPQMALNYIASKGHS